MVDKNGKPFKLNPVQEDGEEDDDYEDEDQSAIQAISSFYGINCIKLQNEDSEDEDENENEAERMLEVGDIFEAYQGPSEVEENESSDDEYRRCEIGFLVEQCHLRDERELESEAERRSTWMLEVGDIPAYQGPSENEEDDYSDDEYRRSPSRFIMIETDDWPTTQSPDYHLCWTPDHLRPQPEECVVKYFHYYTKDDYICDCMFDIEDIRYIRIESKADKPVFSAFPGDRYEEVIPKSDECLCGLRELLELPPDYHAFCEEEDMHLAYLFGEKPYLTFERWMQQMEMREKYDPPCDIFIYYHYNMSKLEPKVRNAVRYWRMMFEMLEHPEGYLLSTFIGAEKKLYFEWNDLREWPGIYYSEWLAQQPPRQPASVN